MFVIWLSVVVLVNVIKIQAALWLIEVDVGYNVNVCHKTVCVCIGCYKNLSSLMSDKEGHWL